MEESGILLQAVIYLAAAVIAVPLATRLGLGSVLGYLIAGVAIGSHALGLVGDASDEMHFAEFGVALMLFLIGLELQPKKLWQMRGAIIGTGGAQLLLSAGVIAVLALLIYVQSWNAAVAIGLILALSSTAIVLQSLSEKGLLKTEGGRSAFAVLLFQDIAVIPILALLPLLASGAAPVQEHGGLEGWQYGAAVIATMLVFILAGRYLLGPLLRLVAGSQVREMFTVTALLIVVGSAALMTWLELSPALGTFLAGVILAESEFRHELEADIEPFKGLLLGLFFIAVGANLNFNLIAQYPLLLAVLVLLLVVTKFVVLFALARVTGMSRGEDWLFALSLAQAGEFGFVLVSFSAQNGVLDATTGNLLIALIALSMAITPVLLLVYERFILPRYMRGEETEREEEPPVDEGSPVIIVGYGRFGQIAGRLLNASGFETTLLERNAEQLDLVRRYGIRAYYGDASREDLLRAAGAKNARLVILTLSDQAASLEIVTQLQKHFPHLTILARARNRMHQYALMEAGVKYIFRETVDSALSIGECALQLLGQSKFQASRAARKFKQHDQRMLESLFPYWRDESTHIAQTKVYREQLLQALREDRRDKDLHLDHHWKDSQPGL